MATDVLSVLREQLSEAEDQVRRLTTAIAALAGADLTGGARRGRLHKGVSGGDTANGSERTGGRLRKAVATIGGMGARSGPSAQRPGPRWRQLRRRVGQRGRPRRNSNTEPRRRFLHNLFPPTHNSNDAPVRGTSRLLVAEHVQRGTAAYPRFESVCPLFSGMKSVPKIVLHREPFAASHVLNTCLYLGFRADLADPEEA
jgi:hypothetical protein